jgi:hypothetical protein
MINWFKWKWHNWWYPFGDTKMNRLEMKWDYFLWRWGFKEYPEL